MERVWLYEELKTTFVVKGECYICKRPYIARECPKLGSLSATHKVQRPSSNRTKGLINVLVTMHVNSEDTE